MISGLVAYPAEPPDLKIPILLALDGLHQQARFRDLLSWEETDTPGRFIASEVMGRIDAGTVFVADITRLNFNVIFEIGYAIGRRKRVFIIRNTAIVHDVATTREVGILGTLGHKTYADSTELVSALSRLEDLTPLHFDDRSSSRTAPVYILLPETKGDFETRLVSRVKKARLNYRSFDPQEHGRLSALDAIENVATSHGVIASLLPTHYKQAVVHNLRAAFVAGLAQAMGKPLLLLQFGEDPVPLDYRDLVRSFRLLGQIDEHVAEFAPAVTESMQAARQAPVGEPSSLLQRLSLGAPAAENEMQELASYYLKTDEYHRAMRGEVQVVLGRKGTGKTALFFQLRNRLRSDKRVVVLDLKPEGFQLRKFKEQVLDFLEEGTREHTITAFWEYLLMLEVCHKLLQKDQERHVHDHLLYQPYIDLASTYSNDEYVTEGDFAERMLRLTQRIADDFAQTRSGSGLQRLQTGEITELLHKHDVGTCQQE
jgi:hypothetical protein